MYGVTLNILSLLQTVQHFCAIAEQLNELYLENIRIYIILVYELGSRKNVPLAWSNPRCPLC